MKIAQIAPLFERVPPKLYGGTERVVSYLTEELVHQGHDVTLFASGDSITSAKLEGIGTAAVRLDPHCVAPDARQVLLLERVFCRAHEFDVLHFHIDYLHFPFSKRQSTAALTTLHGRLDLSDLVPLYARFGEMPVVSISDAQRRPLPAINWQATVHHGLPLDLHAPRLEPGGYLAFLGRISPEKRADRAIRIAERAGMKLLIAAKVDPVDEAYFKARIRPLLASPWVEFIGEIGEHEKQEFLAGATALLFPIDWPEPFGLVIIEAMACGTPVIAYSGGSVSEIIEPGVSGFIVESIGEAVQAVQNVGSLSRAQVRRRFEERFSVERMAREYVTVYQRLARSALRLDGLTDERVA
jgi:glycosyltransferase involved in cell wall biosynthesis